MIEQFHNVSMIEDANGWIHGVHWKWAIKHPCRSYLDAAGRTTDVNNRRQ